MLSAALSFGLLHAVALLTPAFDFDASAADVNVPQLIHLMAVILRFAVPFGCLTAALNAYAERRKATAHDERVPALD